MTAPSTPRRPAPVGWWPWALMVVVVVALLAVGTLGGDPPTLDERARNLEESIRCPSCASQAVANSDTPAAEAVRVLIAERLEAGDSDEEIRDYVASRYPNGRQLLLDPAGQGFGALVWALPVMAAILAVGALIYRFGDWRPGSVEASDDDRALVAAALAHEGATASDPGADPGADPGTDPDEEPDEEPDGGPDPDGADE